jgi:hypothetical protein
MLTVGKLKEVIRHLPNEMPVLYARTWLSPKDASPFSRFDRMSGAASWKQIHLVRFP